MTNELKNCPFCGGEGAQFDGVDRENKKSSSVICLDCGCKIFRADFLRADAIKAWNTRTQAPAVSELVKALEMAVTTYKNMGMRFVGMARAEQALANYKKEKNNE